MAIRQQVSNVPEDLLPDACVLCRTAQLELVPAFKWRRSEGLDAGGLDAGDLDSPSLEVSLQINAIRMGQCK